MRMSLLHLRDVGKLYFRKWLIYNPLAQSGVVGLYALASAVNDSDAAMLCKKCAYLYIFWRAYDKRAFRSGMPAWMR